MQLTETKTDPRATGSGWPWSSESLLGYFHGDSPQAWAEQRVPWSQAGRKKIGLFIQPNVSVNHGQELQGLTAPTVVTHGICYPLVKDLGLALPLG